ncbi:PBSX family phage terminase large subunit [Bacillus thuringiensis]|uniref:PBSX family phage terminase large subunit n=1 Tax=Bacillus thuringiensis TaxID=1428 RepID=UPI00207AB625|nr:PBSX family phage terminase large subunit [Bacillus thuringiensis]USL16276.1 PBSX family phage terminase large subunit [Bacillus thuringiensis]
MVEKEVNPRFEDFLFDWNHKNYFLVGGYGSSKSYHVALKIVLKLLEEKRKCLVIREVYETIKESCFALFVDIIENLGLSDSIRVTESPMKIKFPNGSVIIFRGMDKPEKIKSVHNVSMVWLEEASEIKYEGFKEVKKRMRHPSLKLHMILSTNPVSVDNWVYLHFFKDEVNERVVLDDEDLYEKHTVVVKDTYYHHSTADDNLFLPQSYIDELDETKEYDPDLYRVARYGKFGVNGVKVLPQFEMMDAEKMDEIIKDQRKLMLRVGMDFGFETSFNAVVRMAIDHEKKYLYLYWEYYKNKQTDPQTAKDLIALKESGEHIKADSAEPKTIAYFRQKGFEMSGAKKFQGSRLANTKKVKRFKKIICSTACPNIRRELKNLTYKKDKNGNIILDEFNIDPHTFSAIWYGLDGYEVADLKELSHASAFDRVF